MELRDRPMARDGVRRLTVIARDAASGRWRIFERPIEIMVARKLDDVIPALEKIEHACVHEDRHAAGFIAYEAAPAFDPSLKTHAAGDFPLLWFGL
jgi:para-aminobenzoate synthetase/4-amino-4-deoxychorismate lyase